MDLASTLPIEQIYQILTGKPSRSELFGFLIMLRLWRLRRVSELFARYIHKQSEVRTKEKATNDNKKTVKFIPLHFFVGNTFTSSLFRE